ncbi:MAG: GPW/gp25 family protein [Dehalococcoidales bacterium]|nr:MAG: GPW/gp25 family protein [Dehalococcoidales bacterium]
MVTDPSKDILGTGWSYPIKIDGRGGIALAQHENDIEESIRVILSTAKGERRMRPNFGCDVHKLIYAPNNATTWGLAIHYVEEALGWWEPRIEVTDVQANADPLDTSRLLIDIKYQIKATNDARNIVFPFYLMPGAV